MLAPEAAASSEGLLADFKRRANDIAAAVSKLLNTASVRLDDVRVHVRLDSATGETGYAATPAASLCTASAPGSQHAATSGGAGPSNHCSQHAPQSEDSPACAALYVDCIRAGSTDWGGTGASGVDVGDTASSRHCEKTVLWDGLSIRVCETCCCALDSGMAEPQAAAEPTSSESSHASNDSGCHPDEDGDCFFAATDEPCVVEPESGGRRDRAGTLIFAGTGPAGFGGRLELALRWASRERGGALQRVHVDVSSAAGALVPLHAHTLASTLRVARAVQRLARSLGERSTRRSTIALTESVVRALHPADGLAEAAAVAAADRTR